jgi:hypothetical protein
MNYTNFHHQVVLRYSVDIKGWPLGKFANPTDPGNSLPPLLELREALTSGRCHFVKLTPAELSAKIGAYQGRVASGEVVPPARKKRSDAGRSRKTLKTLKSADIIASDDESASSSSSSNSSSSPSPSSSSSSSEEEQVAPPLRKSSRSTKVTTRRGVPEPITSSIVLANITNKRKRQSTQVSDTENIVAKKTMHGS